MDGATKKFIQEENEKLAFLISQHIGRLDEKVGGLEEKIEGLDEKIELLENTMKKGFADIDERLSHIEYPQEQRLTKLEDNMRIVKTHLGIR
jgi:archaellum component FlaC